jgi:hypothetical protein
MKKLILLLQILLVTYIHPKTGNVESDCTIRGKKLYGYVQIVDTGEDITIQNVTTGEDIRIEVVRTGPSDGFIELSRKLPFFWESNPDTSFLPP